MPGSRQEEEFFNLLRPQQGKLYRTAWAILNNEADARDAMQEATIRAYRAFPALRGGPEAFPPWMRRIVINQCTQILRARMRVVPMAEPHHLHEEPVTPLEVPGEGSEVWDAVRTLPDHYRVVVVLRFLADMQLEDIAAALNIPLGTVKSRLHATLKILRSKLETAERGQAV